MNEPGGWQLFEESSPAAVAVSDQTRAQALEVVRSWPSVFVFAVRPGGPAEFECSQLAVFDEHTPLRETLEHLRAAIDAMLADAEGIE